jgi:hypothetical protein
MAIPSVEQFSQQPGGGLAYAMRGLNALTQSNLENKIKASEAQYAPWTNYANAASKLAYSQFVGPQAIAAILNNPATRGMFTRDQYNQLANAFAQQVRNPAMSMANLPPPNAISSPRGDGLLSRIINSLSGIGSGAPQSQPPGMPMVQDQAPSSGQGPDNAMLQQPQAPDQGNAINQPPQPSPSYQSVPNALQGTSPTYSRLAGQQLPADTYGASSPGAIIGAGEAGLKAQTEAEAKAITEQWTKRQDDINKQAAGSQEMSRQLDRLSQARSELSMYEKGPGLGSLPALSNAAQTADLASNNLVAARLKEWQSQRITNMDIGFGKMLKPGRWMNDQSFHNEVEYEKSLNDRLQEYPAFSQRAQLAGLTPAQADAVWIRYANERPFYDVKNKKILWDNMGSWENYLTPDSIQQTFSPSYRKQMQKYQSNMAGGNTEQDKKIQDSYLQQTGVSHGSKMLSKNLELPQFNSKEEFLSWYKQQPKVVQDAVKLRLGGK